DDVVQQKDKNAGDNLAGVVAQVEADAVWDPAEDFFKFFRPMRRLGGETLIRLPQQCAERPQLVGWRLARLQSLLARRPHVVTLTAREPLFCRRGERSQRHHELKCPAGQLEARRHEREGDQLGWVALIHAWCNPYLDARESRAARV